MKKRILQHIHKLKKVKYSNGESKYFCILGECEYTINIKLALGKPCECHRCARPFNLTEAAIKLVKPHCVDCTKGKPNVKVQTTSPADELLKRLSQSFADSLAKNRTEDTTDESDSDLL